MLRLRRGLLCSLFLLYICSVKLSGKSLKNIYSAKYKNMEVIFETAELAKEKGFDYQCKKGYIEKGICIEYPDKNYYSNSDLDTDWLKENYTHRFAAPTQSKLQKWLREKNRHIEIGSHLLHMSAFEKVRKWYVYFRDEKIDVPHDTYEQALEIGLQKALKSVE